MLREGRQVSRGHAMNAGSLSTTQTSLLRRISESTASIDVRLAGFRTSVATRLQQLGFVEMDAKRRWKLTEAGRAEVARLWPKP